MSRLVRLVYGEFAVSLVEDSHPREAMVEVTRRCNYSCLYCFRDGLDKSYLIDMEESLFQRFINMAVDAGIEKLAFTGWGEPLLHPNILEFIGLAKENGFDVLVNTNGFFVAELARDLVKMGVDELVISVDSGDEDIYRSIRRGGELSRVVEGLDRLNMAKASFNSKKPVLKFQYTLNKLNISNILGLARLAKDYRVKEVIISNIIPNNPGVYRNLQCLGDSHCLELLDGLKEDLARITLDTNISFILPSLRISSERHCPFIERDAFYLTAEGDVAPCIYYAHSWRPIINGFERNITPVRFGNISDKDILDIWRGIDYTRFRFNVRFSMIPSCLDCELEDVCLITRSNEYDCWGNAPTCSACPYARRIVYCPL